MFKSRRVWVLLVIAIIDVGIVYFAVHLRAKNQNAVPPAVIIHSPQPTTTPTPREVPTHPAGDALAATSYSEPMISAVDDNVAWRAVGFCKPGDFIATTDEGSDWLTVPVPDGFPYILNLHETSASHGWVLAADDNCVSVTRFTTQDGGQHWKASSSLGSVWIPAPVGIRGPTGAVSNPCGRKHPSAVSFTSAGTSGPAIVVCHRGVLRSTDDGKTWVPVGPISAGNPIAVALTASGKGNLLMANDDGCKEGTRVLTTTDFGASWQIGSCLRVAKVPIAFAIADDGRGMLLTLSSRYRTTDYGQNWD